MLSPEVQSAVDEIRRNKSLTKSLQAERDLWKQKAMDAQEKLDKASSVSQMSDEDKEALRKESAELDALNDELEGAAQENTKPEGGGSNGVSPDDHKSYVAPVGSDDHPTEPLTSGDVLNANGPANHPAGGTVPMMPTSAFDPAPNTVAGPTDTGQPAQPKAIETPGGFVIAGGGSVSRAVGSSPESPSSSLVVPLDPDAKAPASTADVAKSGLGDSSQNALKGNDGQLIGSGPGMPQEPTPDQQEAAQKLKDAQDEERVRREANPLNLAEPGNNAQKGAPAPGTPGPDPIAGPPSAPVDETKPNAPAIPA